MKIMSRLSILFLVTLALLLTSVLPAMAETAQPTDVSPDHWAYKAIVTLVDKGYLTYFQDGSFRGETPIDRFNLAVIVAKILNEVAIGTKTTSKEDMALLRKLTVEFQDELVALSTKVNLFDERLTYLENGNKTSQDDAARNENQIQGLQAEARQMVADILALKARVEYLEGKDKLRDQDLGAIRDRLSTVEKDVKKLKSWSVLNTILSIIGILT